MTTPGPIRSPIEKLEDDALVAGIAAAGALSGVEVAAIVLLGLLVCPPLAILALLVVVPLLVVALVGGLLAAVLSTPYLLVHQFRNPHAGHLSLLSHRLRRAARSLVDLLPHRIVADARNSDSGR
jgi:hypothetical protein